MRLFGREMKGPARVLVIFVAVLLVSAGMCGLQLTIGDRIYNSKGAFGLVMVLLGILELAAMLVSLAGIAAVLLNLLITMLFRRGPNSSRDGAKRVFLVTSQVDELQDRTSRASKGKDGDTTR